MRTEINLSKQLAPCKVTIHNHEGDYALVILNQLDRSYAFELSAEQKKIFREALDK